MRDDHVQQSNDGGACERAEKAHGQPTADLLTQRLQIHEKTAWMLRSLLA